MGVGWGVRGLHSCLCSPVSFGHTYSVLECVESPPQQLKGLLSSAPRENRCRMDASPSDTCTCQDIGGTKRRRRGIGGRGGGANGEDVGGGGGGLEEDEGCVMKLSSSVRVRLVCVCVCVCVSGKWGEEARGGILGRDTGMGHQGQVCSTGARLCVCGIPTHQQLACM